MGVGLGDGKKGQMLKYTGLVSRRSNQKRGTKRSESESEG